MRHLIIFIALLLSQGIHAKNPKFFKKARPIQLTILATDKDGKIQQGQGYFLNESGDVLAEYNTLKDAVSVKAVDFTGKEYNLRRVMGASSLYNMVRLSCTETGKKQTFAPILTDALSTGTVVYVMPMCSTDKDAECLADTISKVETFDNEHNYYTLTRQLDERLSGAPVFTEQGELIGSVQLSADENATHGYIIAATYGQKLTITGIDANNYDLRSLKLPKQLPADESQATTYLFLVSKQDTANYRTNVEDFVDLFPKSSTGYIQLAEYEVRQGNFSQAEKVYADALEHCETNQDDIHHSFAKLLYQSGLHDEPVHEGWTLDKALTEANAAYTKNPLPLYTALQGMILYGLQKYDEAYAQFLKMSQTNMRSSEYFLYAAQCKQMMQAPAEEILAMQDSAMACYTKPYPVEAANSLYLRSKTLAALKRYREAVLDLNEYEHLYAGNLYADFYYEREQLEMQCRMYQQALNDIDRAVTIQPKEPLFFAEQAVVNYRVGQIDEAMAAAREAIRLDDAFADAYRILGICLIDKNKKEEARKNLQRAIELGDEMATSVLEKLK